MSDVRLSVDGSAGCFRSSRARMLIQALHVSKHAVPVLGASRRILPTPLEVGTVGWCELRLKLETIDARFCVLYDVIWRLKVLK